MSAYAYALLCAGCYLSYLGAPPLTIIAVGALLALPSIVKPGRQKASPMEFGVHIAVALIFALLAHIVGWGIAGVIGT